MSAFKKEVRQVFQISTAVRREVPPHPSEMGARTYVGGSKPGYQVDKPPPVAEAYKPWSSSFERYTLKIFPLITRFLTTGT